MEPVTPCQLLKQLGLISKNTINGQNTAVLQIEHFKLNLV